MKLRLKQIKKIIILWEKMLISFAIITGLKIKDFAEIKGLICVI